MLNQEEVDVVKKDLSKIAKVSKNKGLSTVIYLLKDYAKIQNKLSVLDNTINRQLSYLEKENTKMISFDNDIVEFKIMYDAEYLIISFEGSNPYSCYSTKKYSWKIEDGPVNERSIFSLID